MPPLAVSAAFSALLCLGLIAALAGSQSDVSENEPSGVLYAGLVLAASSLIGLISLLLKPSFSRYTMNVLSGLGIAASSGLFWRYAPGGEVLGILATVSFAISITLQLATKTPFRSALIASALTGVVVISIVLLKERPDHISFLEPVLAWMVTFLLSAPLSVLTISLIFDRSLRESRV